MPPASFGQPNTFPQIVRVLKLLHHECGHIGARDVGISGEFGVFAAVFEGFRFGAVGEAAGADDGIVEGALEDAVFVGGVVGQGNAEHEVGDEEAKGLGHGFSAVAGTVAGQIQETLHVEFSHDADDGIDAGADGWTGFGEGGTAQGGEAGVRAGDDGTEFVEFVELAFDHGQLGMNALDGGFVANVGQYFVAGCQGFFEKEEAGFTACSE